MVDNSGSTARDLLAAERTFLAWARTGLGFLGAGTGLFSSYAHAEEGISDVQRRLQQERALQVLPACLALWANGAVTLAFAVGRYYSVARAIQIGKFPLGKMGLLGIITTTACSSVYALAVITREEQHEMQRLLGTPADRGGSAK